MTETLTPDICVIGAGSGGLTVAAASAKFGVDVVLIEKGKMGGDCLNYGCVPSKATIAAAKHAASFRSAPDFGVTFDTPKIDYQKVHDHIHDVIATIAPMDSVERFEGLGVHVILDAAKFIDKETVEAGGKRIKARRFVIATGSRAAVPPVPGLADIDYLTNETIFDLTEPAGRLLVVGGGPIGMELAQAQARLGNTVTVVEMAKTLAKDDQEMAEIVRESIRADGVTLLEETRLESISQLADGSVEAKVTNSAGEQTLVADKVLVAAGRAPVLDGLNLEAAGVTYTSRGITVSKYLKTSNPKIFAIGDCAGGLQFTHVAGYHAGLVVGQLLFRAPLAENRDMVPWVTFTSPELAHVGLTEAQARKTAKHGMHVKVLSWSYHENDRAIAERKTKGMIKVVVGKGGKILGADIVGEGAGEMINMWSLAVSSGLKISALRNMISPYPTMAEIGKRAALLYYADSVKSPMVRRIITFLRRFG